MFQIHTECIYDCKACVCVKIMIKIKSQNWSKKSQYRTTL